MELSGKLIDDGAISIKLKLFSVVSPSHGLLSEMMFSGNDVALINCCKFGACVGRIA